MSDYIETGADGAALSLMDVVAEEEDLLEKVSNREEIRAVCRAVNAVLSEQEKQVIVLRYGLEGGAPLPADGQIAREIAAFRDFYGPTLRPAMFLSYEREAYYPVDGEDFRLTLDENILWRTDHVDLGTSCFGTSLLDPDQVLMELKTPGGIPLWMVRFLSDNDIRKVSFSKYGTAYRQMLGAEKTMGGKRYA